MVYWCASEAEKVPSKIDRVLQFYFPDRTWGAIPLVNSEGVVELITIDKVTYTGGGRHGDESVWTHFANIQNTGDGWWEVNTQFMGDGHDEMWVYAYYRRFADAVKFVASGKFMKKKPIKKY